MYDRNVTVSQAFQKCINDQHVILDVRTSLEWKAGIAKGSLCFTLSDFEALAPEKLSKDVCYYVICRTGKRAKLAIEQLSTLGFNKLVHVENGYVEWLAQELPIEQVQINQYDLRYDRHYQLQGFGRQAQEKLNKAHILLIGAGGLGSSCALYLAAAGVGQISIIDDDVVQLSNLQRQIIHTTNSIDRPKVESAYQRLAAINPDIIINPIKARLDQSNIDELVNSVDIVIDGSDNLLTRYLTNDTCLKYNKPLVYAAVYQYEAQVSVFDFRLQNSPCLRCLFPETKGFEPENCSTAGVLGVVPGMAGVMQASETIKLITGIGTTLNGQLLVFDLLDNSFRTIKYSQDLACQSH